MVRNFPRVRQLLLPLGFLAAMLPGTATAQSSEYPNRPIRLIVGFVAGGPSDVVARVIGHELNVALGQPVVVENKPGADANIAMDFVSRSAPDGYTLLLAQSGMTINPAMYDSFKLRPDKDFTHIGMIGEAANVIAVNSNVPAQSVEELIAYTKANPGKLNYASSSSPTRLATEMFNAMAGTKMVMIPYKGTPPAITDLLAGHVQVLISSVTTLQPQRRNDHLRFLATTGSKRAGLMSDLPTVAESGIPGYEAVTWYGLAGPVKMPADIAAKLETALNAALAKPELLAKMREFGLDVRQRTPADFARFLKEDLAKWEDVVAKSGAKVE
jgi:tripartite-type tricarboxylate transporter receptor subunit TctC